MAEIDFPVKWREIMIGLAAENYHFEKLAAWLLGHEGDYDDPEINYEVSAKNACRYFDLDPEADFDEVLELSESRLEAQVFDSGSCYFPENGNPGVGHE